MITVTIKPDLSGKGTFGTTFVPALSLKKIFPVENMIRMQC